MRGEFFTQENPGSTPLSTKEYNRAVPWISLYIAFLCEETLDHRRPAKPIGLPSLYFSHPARVNSLVLYLFRSDDPTMHTGKNTPHIWNACINQLF
jgi:hypothetical protein